MKNMTVMIENIRGLSFGATMCSYEEFEEYKEDGILGDTPFEIIDSIVCGPLVDEKQHLNLTFGNDKHVVEIESIPAFSSNKEIVKSGFFTEEQAVIVKDRLKYAANDYYSVWRSGQRPCDDERLLEVEERGSGSMVANLEFQEPFDKDNFFLVLATTLPDKETVIEAVGYKNPDGSISEANFEYDLYSYYNPTVKYDGDDIC